MESADHLKKAARLEDTMRKLDMAKDGETIIENCMLAGTHLVNAALHHSGASAADIIHSDLLAIDRRKGLAIAPTFVIEHAELKVAFEALGKIEGVRPEYIRGPSDCTAKLAADIMEAYDVLKKSCFVILERSLT
jgi:hypothetical protein